MKLKYMLCASLLAVVFVSCLWAAPGNKRKSAKGKAAAPVFAADMEQRQIWLLKKGKKLQVSGFPEDVLRDGQFMFSWAVVDLDQPREPEKKTGIVFFNEEGKQLKYLPVKGITPMTALSASPDCSRFAVSIPAKGKTQKNVLYSYPQLKQFDEVEGSSDDNRGVIWIDNARFLFTSWSDRGSRRPADSPAYGMRSVAMYDLTSKKTQELVKATEKDDYIAVSTRDGFAKYLHVWVENTANWNNMESESENNGVFMESAYCWLPVKRESQSPGHVYSLDLKKKTVISHGLAGTKPYAAKLHFSHFGEPENGLPCWWFAAQEEGDPAMIYVFIGDDASLAAAIPAEDPRLVRDVRISMEGQKVIVSCGVEGSQDRVLHLYDLGYQEDRSLKHEATLSSAYGDFFWADPWRVVYTKKNREYDLKSSVLSHALEPWVYDSAVGLDEKIREAGFLESYRVTGVSAEGMVELERLQVQALEDWKDPGKVRRERLQGELPAAG